MKKIWKLEGLRIENRTYLIVWSSFFIAESVISLSLASYDPEMSAGLSDIWALWIPTLPFLLLFVIHNYLIAPLLTEKMKVAQYVVAAFALYLLFAAFILFFPNRMMENTSSQFVPISADELLSVKPFYPQLMRLSSGLLIIGANIGAKFLFISLTEKRRMEYLERENLHYRLEYLKYQINPHFLMNTLNNIHALVDIDGEKAKESIIELSRLMRHLLYGMNGTLVPLRPEIDIAKHFIALMSLRFNDKVHINTNLEVSSDKAEIPPMILTTIIENAFKHGVSYKKDSFITISLECDGKMILFRCTNSKNRDNAQNNGIGDESENVLKINERKDEMARELPASTGKNDADAADKPTGKNSIENDMDNKSHGIGLGNIQKRLDLIYGSEYTMLIEDNMDIYDLHLSLPSKCTQTHNRIYND